MAPLPKRKHSTQRKGKRIKTKTVQFPKLIKCENCGKLKIAHRICKYCHK